MTLYLADASAWHRSEHPDVASRWVERLRGHQIATCHQARLEILFSAQSTHDYELVGQELLALHWLPCGEPEFVRALEVQRELGRAGALHHRSVKIADLLVAASAEVGGATVWHYDEDFDRIAEVTGQPTEWIAPRGSL